MSSKKVEDQFEKKLAKLDAGISACLPAGTILFRARISVAQRSNSSRICADLATRVHGPSRLRDHIGCDLPARQQATLCKYYVSQGWPSWSAQLNLALWRSVLHEEVTSGCIRHLVRERACDSWLQRK